MAQSFELSVKRKWPCGALVSKGDVCDDGHNKDGLSHFGVEGRALAGEPQKMPGGQRRKRTKDQGSSGDFKLQSREGSHSPPLALHGGVCQHLRSRAWG